MKESTQVFQWWQICFDTASLTCSRPEFWVMLAYQTETNQRHLRHSLVYAMVMNSIFTPWTPNFAGTNEYVGGNQYKLVLKTLPFRERAGATWIHSSKSASQYLLHHWSDTPRMILLNTQDRTVSQVYKRGDILGYTFECRKIAICWYYHDQSNWYTTSSLM